MVYLKSAGICGQSDLVEVVNGHVNIIDYKTNKEIKMESFKNWEGISEKMLHPVSNLEDPTPFDASKLPPGVEVIS